MWLKLQFLIPSKDNDQTLEKCLDSLVPNLPLSNRAYQIGVLIVRQYLNKTTKKTFFQLINNHKYRQLKITYIITKKGTGYIQNLNTGIKSLLQRNAPPKYIALLHDDVVIDEKWLEKMIFPLQQNKDISVLTSLSNNKFDKKLLDDWYESFGITSQQKQFENAKPALFSKDQYQSAALYSTVIRTDIFKKYGLFDQNIITPYNFEYQYFKNLMNNGQKVALAPYIIKHECKSILNQRENDLNSIRAKFHIDLKNKLKQNKKKNVIYTYLNSNKLNKLQNIFRKYNDKNVDLICFSNVNTKIDKWNVIDISLLNIFDNEETFIEFLKLHPHYFFNNYQKSIWVDFNQFNMIPLNIDLILNKMTTNYLALDDSQKYLNSWKYLYQMRYDWKINNDQFEQILSLYQIYHFPVDTEFLNSSFLIRNHNDLTCINTMNKIWRYYISFIQNDKFLFNLCLWVNKESYDSINYEKFMKTMNKLLEKSL